MWAKISMEGNPIAYEHPVFNWDAEKPDGYSVYVDTPHAKSYVYVEELRRLKYGLGAYVLVRFQKV